MAEETIEPAKTPATPYVFPNAPVRPTTPLVFDDSGMPLADASAKKPMKAATIVALFAGVILLAEIVAWTFTHVSAPSMPSLPRITITWPDKESVAPKEVVKEVPKRDFSKPVAPLKPEESVDTRAALIELLAEHVRLNRQIAFEAKKPRADSGVVERATTRLDEINREVRVLAAKIPVAEHPPEVERFLKGSK